MGQYMKCPKCHSFDFGGKIEGGDTDQDGDTIWKIYYCDCGFSWQEIYEFTHNETADGNCNELDDTGKIK